IVVVGHGMVGVRFLERMIERDRARAFALTVIGEEPELAYNRVGLTQFFAHRDREQLLMQPLTWFQQQNILVHRTKVTAVDRAQKYVHTTAGERVFYDTLVLATGSYAW